MGFFRANSDKAGKNAEKNRKDAWDKAFPQDGNPLKIDVIAAGGQLLASFIDSFFAALYGSIAYVIGDKEETDLSGFSAREDGGDKTKGGGNRGQDMYSATDTGRKERDGGSGANEMHLDERDVNRDGKVSDDEKGTGKLTPDVIDQARNAVRSSVTVDTGEAVSEEDIDLGLGEGTTPQTGKMVAKMQARNDLRTEEDRNGGRV